MFIEKRRKRNNKPWVIAFCALLGIGFCIYCYNYVQGTSSGQARTTPTPSSSQMIVLPTLTPSQTPGVAPTPSDSQVIHQEVRLSNDADVAIVYSHTLCKHEKTVALTDKSWAGMTREQLAAAYPNAKVVEFSAKRARLSQSIAQYCPEHYFVRYEDGDICVYQPELGKTELKRISVLEDVYLPYPDADLEKGIVFDSVGDLEIYLENFDS